MDSTTPIATVVTDCPECEGRITVVTDGTRAYALTESPLIASQVWDRVEQDAIVSEDEDGDLIVTCQSGGVDSACGAEVVVSIRSTSVGTHPFAPFMTEIKAA